MNKIFILMLFVIIPLTSFGQYYENKEKEKQEEKKSFKENLFFGGILGLQFGTYTLVDISPVIGYKVSPRFQPGIRLTYQFQKDSRTNYQTSRYGGSVFARLFVVQGLYAQVEAEALNIEWLNSNLEEYRLWIGNYFVGGGYFQKMGKRGGMYMTVLWNLNETVYSPYSNPIIRMGFTF